MAGEHGGKLWLHRKSLDSRVFSDDWLWRLWCWCLMRACWKRLWKDGREYLPGQFTLGRNEAADQLSVSPSKLYRGLQTLQEWGQIRLEANTRFTTVTICNWEVYQNDNEKSEQPVNSQWTAGEQPVNTPLVEEEGKEGKEEPPLPPSGGILCADSSPSPTPEEFVQAWNAVTGFTKLRVFTPKRLKHFRARCKDASWVRDWRLALDLAAKKPFCLGHNDRGWVADVEWFLRPDVVARLMEGNYLNNGTGPPPPPAESTAERTARLTREREESLQHADPEAVRALLAGKLRRNGAAED